MHTHCSWLELDAFEPVPAGQSPFSVELGQNEFGGHGVHCDTSFSPVDSVYVPRGQVATCGTPRCPAATAPTQ